MPTGSATLDFGAAPGSQKAQVDVTGQTGILSASSLAEAFMMADSTVDHNVDEHQFVSVKLTCGNLVDGVGFTIYAVSIDLVLTGTFMVRWVWI